MNHGGDGGGNEVGLESKVLRWTRRSKLGEAQPRGWGLGPSTGGTSLSSRSAPPEATVRMLHPHPREDHLFKPGVPFDPESFFVVEF